MKGFFVTGTDTNVGKTVLSALLVAALDGIYWKPVQTGAIEGTDRNSVRSWAACPDERLLLERYYFDRPVSPHLAAREGGIRIALDAFELPAPVANHPHIVEGAGGAMVPLNEKDLMLDLMRHLGLPVVVAARTTLGTINHTLLTLAAPVACLTASQVGLEVARGIDRQPGGDTIEDHGELGTVRLAGGHETQHATNSRSAAVMVLRSTRAGGVFFRCKSAGRANTTSIAFTVSSRFRSSEPFPPSVEAE